MAPGPKLSLLFLLLAQGAGPARPQETPNPVTGAVGGVAFLHPRTPQDPSKYSQIHWRWKNEVKIAGRRRGQEAEYPRSRLEGRLELFENCTLKIRDLGVGDSSEYLLYREDEQGLEEVESVRLQVYDLVPKPHVRAVTSGHPGRCQATLSCSVALDGVTYEWIPPQKLPGTRGPVLSVSFDPEVETYVCRVSNAVSSNNASLTYRHPCRWTGESSSFASRAHPGILGQLLLLFLLILLLPVP